ncbi:MAG: diguanylate cyclase [Burkholderiales bacterium]|nr:diguanylate cyclase [Burkholderiales bacterium]
MTEPSDSGLGKLSTHAFDIFQRFPAPLALVAADGPATVNRQFGLQLDETCLETEAVRAVAGNPGGPGARLRLAGKDNREIDMHVSAVRVENLALLVFDDTPGPDADERMAELQQRITELERSSSTDHLTGAWNRAHLDRIIETELSRSLRFRQPLSLVLLDIDHFKLINDHHGHQAGDAVLRELVAAIRAGIRTADLLFRWGGEEFVVLATSTSYRKAGILAESLRTKIAQHPFPAIGQLTVSLGVAEHNGNETAAAWFARLDDALYAAKRGGRNRVFIAEGGNSASWDRDSGLSALHLTWREDYECGHPLIDAEHRELFELANVLLEAVVSAKDARPVLDRLIEHVRQHFSDEETILAEHDYPRLEAHRAAHAGLLAKAAELRARLANDDAGLGAVVEFLAGDVVARHLFTADRDFFPLLAGRAAGAVAGNGCPVDKN